MKTAQGTRAKTAGNCQNPGDFGTNGTRGVVLSGMSETTKRAIPTDLMDTGTRWAERVDATHLIAKPVPYHAARANLRAAEGGAERETTNSPEEIGKGCTGRKMASARVALCGFVLTLMLVDIWVVGGAWSVLGAVGLVVWVNVLRREFASGGEGV